MKAMQDRHAGTLMVCAILFTSIGCAKSASLGFDFQNYLENSDIDSLIPRSNANGSLSVNLKAGDYAQVPFCLPVEANVTVLNVMYSNDGESDSVPIFIDEELVGSFDSVGHSDWGYKWNEFLPSGVIGEARTLPPGYHTLLISVNQTDAYGVEIDSVNLDVDIPDFNDEEYLRCEKCKDRVVDADVAYDDYDANTGAVLLLENQGLITSESGQTVAAVDMFPRPLVPCRVVSVAPWYVGEELTGSSTQDVWQIGNKDQSSAEFSKNRPSSDGLPIVFPVGNPTTEFPGTLNSSVVNTFQIIFDGARFPSLFRKPNLTAVVEMGLVDLDSLVEISLQTVSSTRETSPPRIQTFDIATPTNAWEIPVDLALLASEENRLQFTVSPQTPAVVELDYINLSVRDGSTRNPSAVDAREFSIEAVSTGNDPTRPTMAVSGINPAPVDGADAILIQVNPNGGLDAVPIFQLSQDGVISLTSPLLGDFPPEDRRSAFKLAPGAGGIRSVSVNPADISMNVTFVDDSVLRLLIDATSESAEFTIAGASMNIDTETSPLVRFETPWTSDANNGVDTIVTNGRTANQLTNGWQSQEASTVDFINRCGSGEAATSPDWKIELLQ